MIDLIIERLDKCRKSGHMSYMACCPAHKDKSPSLRITQRDGKILLHCLSGCSPDDILAAINLRWSDLFDDESQAAYNAAINQKTRMPRFDPLDHERTIVMLAKSDIESGKTISLEDCSRVILALERLEAASNG